MARGCPARVGRPGQLRACGRRGGVPARCRPAAGAGRRSGGGAAPGGLPPV